MFRVHTARNQKNSNPFCIFNVHVLLYDKNVLTWDTPHRRGKNIEYVFAVGCFKSLILQTTEAAVCTKSACALSSTAITHADSVQLEPNVYTNKRFACGRYVLVLLCTTKNVESLRSRRLLEFAQ